jgi:hypothetical protein
MPIVDTFPDEPPTKQEALPPTRLLVFASRIDRLCELALERLEVDPDADAVKGAMAELIEARALAAGVLR